MKKRPILYILLALAAVVLLAIPLRGLVRDMIVLPVAQFLWLARGYYHAYPQEAYWIIGLVLAANFVVFSLRLPDLEGLRGRRKPSPAPGPVEDLSFWLQRKRSGIFPKWYVARQLAELALAIMERKSTEQKPRDLSNANWNPPAGVREYLEAALKTSYTDYPRPHRSGSQPPTPFDQDLESVIGSLESLLESENDRHS